MPASYLTTDIVVIIVLIVVLVIIGVCAFLIHFYWTKIGVAEIWNTTKWSSMRSSFYRTIHRFSQGNTNKSAAEEPYSDVSIYSNDIDDDIIPVSSKYNKSSPLITSYITPTNNNLNRPVSIIAYNNSVRQNYPANYGQSDISTKSSNTYEYDNRYNDPYTITQKQRF